MFLGYFLPVFLHRYTDGSHQLKVEEHSGTQAAQAGHHSQGKRPVQHLGGSIMFIRSPYNDTEKRTQACQWGEDERQEDETFILVVFLVVDVDENGEQGKEKENHTQSHEGLCALHPTFHPLVVPLVAVIIRTRCPQSSMAVLPRGPVRGSVRYNVDHKTEAHQ